MWDDANAIDHGPFGLTFNSTLFKFNVRAMNPSRQPVSVKDHLDRHAPDRGFRNTENHACLNFGSRCARFSELAQSNAVAHTELRGGSPCSVRQALCQNNPFELPATRFPSPTELHRSLRAKTIPQRWVLHQSAQRKTVPGAFHQTGATSSTQLVLLSSSQFLGCLSRGRTGGRECHPNRNNGGRPSGKRTSKEPHLGMPSWGMMRMRSVIPLSPAMLQSDQLS
jgi:hypothetical protein